MPVIAPLRRRIERSDWFPALTGGAAAAWTMACDRTTRWQVEGAGAVAEATAAGPVLMVLWHEMVMMGSAHWRRDWGRLVTLHDGSPAGRSAAAAQARMGSVPFVVPARQTDLGLTRDILGLVRGGASLAITADGTRGPARVVKDAPLDWARAAGVPVFAYGWAIAGMPRAQSWDRMILARPFARGAIVFRRWDRAVPRRIDDTTREVLRADLGALLTAVAGAAAARVGAA